MASVVATTYAKAIYEVAAEKGEELLTLEQLKLVKDSFSEYEELLAIFAAPFIPKAERLKSVEEVFGGNLSRENLNFLLLLTEKGRIREFSGIVDEYIKLYYREKNICEAMVTSAVALTSEQVEALRKRLSEVTGKEVIVLTKVDASILGGLVVEIDGERMDSSVKTRIANIAKSFSDHTA